MANSECEESIFTWRMCFISRSVPFNLPFYPSNLASSIQFLFSKISRERCLTWTAVCAYVPNKLGSNIAFELVQKKANEVHEKAQSLRGERIYWQGSCCRGRYVPAGSNCSLCNTILIDTVLVENNLPELSTCGRESTVRGFKLMVPVFRARPTNLVTTL